MMDLGRELPLQKSADSEDFMPAVALHAGPEIVTASDQVDEGDLLLRLRLATRACPRTPQTDPPRDGYADASWHEVFRSLQCGWSVSGGSWR